MVRHRWHGTGGKAAPENPQEQWLPKDQYYERGNRGAGRSLDGKLDEFLAGRGGDDTEGDYHGYLSDAAELAKRLEHRGYLIVRAPRDT